MIYLFLGLLCYPAILQANTVDFTYIKKYAELANIVYSNAVEVDSFILKHGGKLIRYHTIPETQVSYFLSRDLDQKKQSISVRGTANLENVLVDLEFKLQQNKTVNIPLHQGFSEAAKAIYDDIIPHLNQNLTITITGHSLGGAIAVILAMYLDSAHYSVDSVITFGQPKVTNVAGAAAFKHLHLIRVVTTLDLVPVVPPFDPIEIKNTDIFWHLGTEIILLQGSYYSVTSGISSMLRAAKFFTQVPNEDNLENHKMQYYLELINAKLDNAIEEPYKNELEILSWFD